jgi:hypothetical protein
MPSAMVRFSRFRGGAERDYDEILEEIFASECRLMAADA